MVAGRTTRRADLEMDTDRLRLARLQAWTMDGAKATALETPIQSGISVGIQQMLFINFAMYIHVYHFVRWGEVITELSWLLAAL